MAQSTERWRRLQRMASDKAPEYRRGNDGNKAGITPTGARLPMETNAGVASGDDPASAPFDVTTSDRNL